MPGHIPEDKLLALGKLVATSLGLYFPSERWRDLERGITSAATKAGHKDVDAYTRWLLTAPLSKSMLETLAAGLTVGETYFFRDASCFNALSEKILPELVDRCRKASRSLRIWSAGCCTGEEPYSVAILLDRLFPAWAREHTSILATDINPLFLKKATAGVYSSWSFRSAPPWLQAEYFTQGEGGTYEILPRIREKVSFTSQNLAEGIYPSLINNTNAMDLILCRNVLMYFDRETTRRVVNSLYQCLLNGSYLLVSPTETSVQTFAAYAAINQGNMILYRKDQGSRAARTGQIPSPNIIEGSISPLPIPAPTTFAFSVSMAPVVEPPPTSPASAEFSEDNISPDAPIPISAQHMASMARSFANLGQLDTARTWVERALELERLDAGLHFLRALILQEQENLDDCKAELKRALYLDLKFVLAHFTLGNIALREDDREKAERHFGNVMSLLDEYPDDQILPHSDGMAAGRLRKIVESTLLAEVNT